jgi:non-homologous end joining protein Ku
VIDLMEALKESLAKRVASGEKKPLAKAKRSEPAAPAAPAKKAAAKR